MDSLIILAQGHGYEIGKTTYGFLYLRRPDGTVSTDFDNVFEILHSIEDSAARWKLAEQITATMGGCSEI